MQNQPTILQKIVQDKAQWVSDAELGFPLSQFKSQLVLSDRDFYTAMAVGSHQQPAYILECKKASPSKGLIRADFNLDVIANVYKNYAAAISVLTDEAYFQGDFRYIKQVRDNVHQPVLCKDFIISSYQVYLARYYQADAILLMLSVLDDQTYLELSELAHSLGMGVLTETSNTVEFERALALKAKVIGVNNRNLHDLSIDMNRIVQLVTQYRDRIPHEVRLISESGIYNHSQIQSISPFAHGFLIGSSLMGKEDLNNAVRAVIFGENKVCGLTRPQDVKAAYKHGALYGGLIFAENSPRAVSLRQAQELVVQAPLRFVGVFQNQPVAFVAQIAKQLQLYAVQLHGDESEREIEALAEELGSDILIWKAVSIDDNMDDIALPAHRAIERYVFDRKTLNQQGGTGMSFDWSKIPPSVKGKVMLAGGIQRENILAALAQGCLGLDLNSGVESARGIKDQEKIRELFFLIRTFHRI